MMAILVLARAYVRSRFTPTVFRSWRLAAGRLPCYFILCLLLLEATPQTRKVAMGILLVGAPTAPTAIQNAQPHPPILGNVDVVNVTRGGSGWTIDTTSFPDTKTFAKELDKTPSSKDTSWSLQLKDVADDRKKERVKRNALRKRYGSSFEATRGRIFHAAEKLDLLVTGPNSDMQFCLGMRYQSKNANISIGLLSNYDGTRHVTRFTFLRDLADFTEDPLGNDLVYIINPTKWPTPLSDDDVKTVKKLAEVVRHTVPTHLPKLPPNLEGSEEVLKPTKGLFKKDTETIALFSCPSADKDFYLNKISVKSKDVNYPLTVKAFITVYGYAVLSVLLDSNDFIPSENGKNVYMFNDQKSPHRLSADDIISLREASMYVPPKYVLSSTPSVVNPTIETTVSPIVHPTRGILSSRAVKALLSRRAEGDKGAYLNYIGDKLKDLNFTFVVVIKDDKEDNSTWFYALLNIDDFLVYRHGDDDAYFYNSGKTRRILNRRDVEIMAESVVFVTPTLPVPPKDDAPNTMPATGDRPWMPQRWGVWSWVSSVVNRAMGILGKVEAKDKGGGTVFEPTEGRVATLFNRSLILTCAEGQKDFYVNNIGVESKDINFSFGLMVDVDGNGNALFNVLFDINDFSPNFISHDNGTDSVYMFNPNKPRHKLRTGEIRIVQNGVSRSAHPSAHVPTKAPIFKPPENADLSSTLSPIFEPTKGYINPGALKVDIYSVKESEEAAFRDGMRDESNDLDFSFGLLVEDDETSQRKKFVCLRDIREFRSNAELNEEKHGNDSVYIVNPKKNRYELEAVDIGNLLGVTMRVAKKVDVPPKDESPLILTTANMQIVPDATPSVQNASTPSVVNSTILTHVSPIFKTMKGYLVKSLLARTTDLPFYAKGIILAVLIVIVGTFGFFLILFVSEYISSKCRRNEADNDAGLTESFIRKLPP
eukprot:GHVS01052404.1.p1 GENE.GHVS01052404.1~~GHVS01052404.1.p1  ORF type:complete len:935 (-),score=71.47 GHVS01052404.1:186-2990(-)